MAENDFQVFAGDPAANVMTQAEYIATGFTSRILGFSSGTAISLQCNKVWRQATMIASMIAQFACDQTGQNMLDDGSPAGMTALETTFTAAVTAVARASVGVGYLPLTGGTLTGPLSITANQLAMTAPSGPVQMSMSRQAGQPVQLLGYTGGSLRWNLLLGDGAAETGGNAGSNFAIARYSDAGAYLEEPFSISRANGVVNFTHPPVLNGAAMPYLPISGGTLNGALALPLAGIWYNGTAGHWIAFDWDGSFARVWVDNGGYIAEIASTSWVNAVAGGYLPVSGGTVNNVLAVNGSFYCYGGAAFSSGVSFAGRGDFYLSYWAPWRGLNWAGGWWDGWNEQTGQRVFVTAGGNNTWVDGSGNWTFPTNISIATDVTAGGWFYTSGCRLANQGVIYANWSANQISFRWDGTHLFWLVDGNGATAYGTTTYMVSSADGRFNRVGMYGGSQYAVGDSDNSTWYLNTFRSDPVFKKNIAEVPLGAFDSLAAIRRVRTSSYEWKAEDAKHPVPVGFISTDLLRAGLIDAVERMPALPDGSEADHLDPVAMLAHLVRSVQQLADDVDTIKRRDMQ